MILYLSILLLVFFNVVYRENYILNLVYFGAKGEKRNESEIQFENPFLLFAPPSQSKHTRLPKKKKQKKKHKNKGRKK